MCLSFSFRESFGLEKTFVVVEFRLTRVLLTISWCFFHEGRFPEASVWPEKSVLPTCPSSSFSKQDHPPWHWMLTLFHLAGAWAGAGFGEPTCTQGEELVDFLCLVTSLSSPCSPQCSFPHPPSLRAWRVCSQPQGDLVWWGEREELPQVVVPRTETFPGPGIQEHHLPALGHTVLPPGHPPWQQGWEWGWHSGLARPSSVDIHLWHSAEGWNRLQDIRHRDPITLGALQGLAGASLSRSAPAQLHSVILESIQPLGAP